MTSIGSIVKSKKAWIAAPLLVVAGGYALLRPEESRSTDFTAGVVMTRMNAADRFTFVAGVVEGLAHARYIRDGKRTDGRSCIYRWFYDNKATIDEIYEGLRLYPDAMPGQVVGALAATECGA